MVTRNDRLQERLARLESGDSLEACLGDLPGEEVTLLRRAAWLRATPEPGLSPERVAAGRATFLRQAGRSAPAPNPIADRWRTFVEGLRPRWSLPLALSGAALAAVALLLVLLFRAGPQVSGGPAVATFTAPDPETAVINERRGLVELQVDEGRWAPVADGTPIRAGQRLRTAELTGATLSFFDGSTARLGPSTELSVEQLEARRQGARIVVLKQWSGETDHEVAASTDPASQYTVDTPSASGRAKGTVFRVWISASQAAHYAVREGVVAVTAIDVTVDVAAGQSSWVLAGQAPQSPVFVMLGEGLVEQAGAAGWQVAGQPFLVDADTLVQGGPRAGDWVRFELRLLLDGSKLADRIALVERGPVSRFALAGPVDTTGAEQWTIAGRALRVDAGTDIDAGAQPGDLVEARGSVGEDGSWLATRIRLLAPSSGEPFEVVGPVEAVSDTLRTVSGIPVTLDPGGPVAEDVVIGTVVRVRGRVLPDGRWLAASLVPVDDSQRDIILSGTVTAMEPLIVAGRRFDVEPRSWLDAGVRAGDRVRVLARGLADGRWLVVEVHRLSRSAEPSFTFSGWVTGTGPWSVAGTSILVDTGTVLVGQPTAGLLVRVSGVIRSDGRWLARRVERLDRRPGCLSYGSAIRTLNAGQLVLVDGRTLDLAPGIQVRGSLQPMSLVQVSGCVQEGDPILVVALIVVLGRLELLPATPAPSPLPPSPAPPTLILQEVVPDDEEEGDDDEPVQAVGTIVIRRNNQVLTLHCSGNAVTVRGNRNTITLLGSCASVTVRGNRNVILLEAATAVFNQGNNNVIQRR